MVRDADKEVAAAAAGAAPAAFPCAQPETQRRRRGP